MSSIHHMQTVRMEVHVIFVRRPYSSMNVTSGSTWASHVTEISMYQKRLQLTKRQFDKNVSIIKICRCRRRALAIVLVLTCHSV